MHSNSLPDDYNKRKVILVVSTNELQKFNTYPDYKIWGSKLLLNPQVYVLGIPIRDRSSLVATLEDRGLLVEQNILVQNPYDTDGYIEAADASSNFGLKKLLYFSYFCQLLGARDILVEQMEMKNTEGKTLFTASVGNSYAEGGIDVEKSAWDKMNSLIKLHDKPKDTDAEPNIEEARNYLNRHRLSHDEIMEDMLVRWQQNRRLGSRQIILNLTRESQRNLNVACSLDIPLYGKAKAQLERLQKESYQFNLTIKLEF